MLNYLKENKIIEGNYSIFHNGVRDDSSINILKCNDTNMLFLDKLSVKDYSNKGSQYWGVESIKESHKKTIDDDTRRLELIKQLGNITNILDFGCGNGGFLQLLDKKIEKYGIDLNVDSINYLNENNIKCYNDLNKIASDIKFDCITMFHVLEHLQNPIEILIDLKKFMHKETILIIEVPSATDILINSYKCESFKNFTFWSEHLCLYTKETLYKLICVSGYNNIRIENEQRYNIFNHLYWLSNNKPGGHKIWNYEDNDLINSYNNFLKKNDSTDTLIAYCKL